MKKTFLAGCLFFASLTLFAGCIPDTPEAPTLAAGQGQLTATWGAAKKATGYEVWYNTVEDSSTATQFPDPDDTNTTCTITGLADESKYYVWVKAKNKRSTSQFSSSASETTLPAPIVAPSAPEAPILAAGDENMTVTWAAVSGATGYEVWFNTVDNNGSATKFADPDDTDTTCIITGLANATEYFIWLKAKNTAGESDFSASASKRTPEWLAIGDASIDAGKVSTLSKVRVYQAVPYVAYSDAADSYRASVVRFNGSSWGQVGGVPASTGAASYLSLFNTNDVLYLSYEDCAPGNSCKATVMKYQSAWTAEGALISDRQILSNSLFIYNNMPYLAILDRETAGIAGDFASVLWKNTDWAYFGNAKFSAPTEINAISLAVHSGIPYTASMTKTGTIMVKYYSSSTGAGSSWSDLGAGFGTVSSEYVSIAAGASGDIYVAYNNNIAGSGKMAVQKYSSGLWDTLPAGGAWASDVKATYGDLFVDGDTPYAAYFNNLDNTTLVKKYTDGQWKTIHEPIAAGGGISDLSIFVENGVPYIAYRNASDNSFSVKTFQSKAAP